MAKRKQQRPTKSQRLMVSFRPDQRQALKQLAKGSGISESHVVRLIVDEFLDKNAGKELEFKLAVKD